MNHLNCEYVREVYPDVLHGRTDAPTTAAVRAHLADCAECRAEAEIIAQLHSVRLAAPAGLQERVLSQLHAASGKRRFGLKYVALAATVAAALIGGPLLLEQLAGPEPQVAVELPPAGLGVITVEAAMVTGTGSLQDLTVEELEQLLGEIES